MTTSPADSGDGPVLAAFGIGPAALLGAGGEAAVYALDAGRALRVHRTSSRAAVARRTELLAEIERGARHVPFRVPHVIEDRTVAGRFVTVESQLPGRPLRKVLDEVTGSTRADLVAAYLDAAARIGDLGVERPWYGDLARPRPIREPTFRAWLEARARASLRAAGATFAAIDAGALAGAWPEPDESALVHLDAFPGNMLTDGSTITAVFDFGTITVAGDRRLDPLTAAIYLEPAFTPVATDADRALARNWLAGRGLEPLLAPARRWLAAFWSGVPENARLRSWARSVLL